LAQHLFYDPAQFESSAAPSGYRPASLQLTPSINPSASPFNQPPTRVGCLSPALPSNHNFQPFIDCQTLQQTFRFISSLRLQPSVRSNLPAGLRLASPANLPVPPSSRPATVAACRSSSHALQPPSSLRLPSIFRLSLPANLFDLRLPVDLPALLPNLTSDSRRGLHLLALPSS